MQQVFQDIFSAVTEEELSEHTHQLVYAYDTCLPPLYAFQVTFPRLEWVKAKDSLRMKTEPG